MIFLKKSVLRKTAEFSISDTGDPLILTCLEMAAHFQKVTETGPSLKQVLLRYIRPQGKKEAVKDQRKKTHTHTEKNESHVTTVL